MMITMRPKELLQYVPFALYVPIVPAANFEIIYKYLRISTAHSDFWNVTRMKVIYNKNQEHESFLQCY